MSRSGNKVPQPSRARDSLQQKTALDINAVFVVKLDGPLQDAEVIRAAAKLEMLPEIVNGTGEKGEARFCLVDTAAKQAIEAWLLQDDLLDQPTIILDSRAKKELSRTSAFPTLGVDSTLLQHRVAGRIQTTLNSSGVRIGILFGTSSVEPWRILGYFLGN